MAVGGKAQATGRFLMLWLALSCAPAALAQVTDDTGSQSEGNPGVRERPRPEYTAVGIPVGVFRFFPELSVGVSTSNNVFASNEGAQSDEILELGLKTKLKSPWARHALELSFGADSFVYSDFSEQSRTNWTFEGDGRLDISQGVFADGSLGYRSAHEDLRDAGSSDIIVEPVAYSLASAALGFSRRTDRLRLNGGVSVKDFDFDDAVVQGGGLLEQDDRDRVTTEVAARVDFFTNPTTPIFLAVQGNWRDYDLAPPDPAATINRDSSGFQILTGAGFEITRLVRGEVGVGYLHQTYDAVGAEDLDGIAVRSSIEWFLDPLATVTFRAERAVRDANFAGARSYVANEVSISVDYEYRRNVILGAIVGVGFDEYDGVDREDDHLRLALSADYLINRGASMFVSLQRDRRASDHPLGRQYDEDRFAIGIRLRR